MQLVRRSLAPLETDYELILLLVCVGSFACAASWLALKLPWPICLFHALTGHPCPTCGATRSAIAFFHGDFLAALKWNPLACLSYCGIVLFNLYALAVVIARGPRLRVGRLTLAEKKLLRIGAVTLLLSNWIYLLIAQ